MKIVTSNNIKQKKNVYVNLFTKKLNGWITIYPVNLNRNFFLCDKSPHTKMSKSLNFRIRK